MSEEGHGDGWVAETGREGTGIGKRLKFIHKLLRCGRIRRFPGHTLEVHHRLFLVLVDSSVLLLLAKKSLRRDAKVCGVEPG